MNLEDAIIVITGASSGMGRAAALEFARKGATVVVAARRAQLLHDVVEECKQINGHDHMAVPTNVADEEAVQHLAHAAIERYGHIDVWVNNAGVGAFGLFGEMPSEVFRQVIETNFFGEVHGTRAVLPYFKQQEHGILINNASLLSQLGGPYYSAYAASKFAIRGFSESVREELSTIEKTDIAVCTVMPATIDTPFFQHAANYTGRAVQALPPVYTVELAAKTIVQCAERPQREVFVGNVARFQTALHSLAPALAEPMTAKQIDTMHYQGDKTSPITSGSVFEPMQEGTGISGGWRTPLTSAPQGKGMTIGAAVAASAALAWFLFRRK